MVRISFYPRHPNLYRKRIDHVDRGVRVGDWVAVYTAENQFIGYGIYNPKSEIEVRLVSYQNLPDSNYWDSELDRAVALRRNTLQLDAVTDSYRVIHAEGDRCPGLVVDRFGEVLSAEVFSAAMYYRTPEILARLAERLGTTQTLIQTSPQFESQEGHIFEPISGLKQESTIIREHGTRFRVRFAGGHKTGFFCDQRDNRKMLAQFCEGKSVLDLCCYTGGFSVQAKKLGKADEVIGVDLDEAPLKLAKENADLNQVRIRFVQADVFPFMRDMVRQKKQFDVVVLDPPKLIRSRAEIEEGTKKHYDLNRLAMQLVKPGGILLSCTCAGLLPRDEFQRLLYSAARQAGEPLAPPNEDGWTPRGPRTMQIFADTGAAPCHPIDSQYPESEYLRAFWMRMS